jgi:hypothetical protein
VNVPEVGCLVAEFGFGIGQKKAAVVSVGRREVAGGELA